MYGKQDFLNDVFTASFSQAGSTFPHDTAENRRDDAQELLVSAGVTGIRFGQKLAPIVRHSCIPCLAIRSMPPLVT
jgi:hypothetical protein